MKSHRETYPEQYTHSLVGKRVDIVARGGKIRAHGVVLRVMDTRFGKLCMLDDGTEGRLAYAVCEARVL